MRYRKTPQFDTRDSSKKTKNTAPKSPVTKAMRTTTLAVNRPATFETLDSHFQLARYELPSGFKWRKDETKYPRLHNQIKDQIAQPYKTFENDKRDGPNQLKCVIYVLYRFNESLQELKYKQGTEEITLKPEVISFEQIDFHMTVKLLQADYFRGEHQPTFVNQGHCVIVAREFKRSLTALEIELKGERHNKNDDKVQYFVAISRAQKYISLTKTDDDNLYRTNVTKAYFVKRTTTNGITLSQVQPSKVAASKDQLFYRYTKSKRRVSLPYHDLRNLTACRGWVLQEFITNFIEHLSSVGLQAEQITRTFIKYQTAEAEAKLALHHLGTVDVFDNRLEKDSPAFSELMDALSKEFEADGVQFHQCVELVDGSSAPTLIFQDYDKEDFDIGGRNQGQNDPKWELYTNPIYQKMPKQSFDVRPPSKSKATSDENDDVIDDTRGEDQLRNLRVALTQLLLKKIILESQAISEALPLLAAKADAKQVIHQLALFTDATDQQAYLGDFAYVRRKTINGDPDFTLLYGEDGVLHFIDLNEGTQFLEVVCQKYGLDWLTIWTQLHRIHFRLNAAGIVTSDKELPRFDLFLGPGHAVEIEQTDEIVLYDYKTMKKRQDAMYEQRSIEEFKRLATYDTNKPVVKQRIDEFMAVLDSIQLDRQRISFEELSRGSYGEQIAEIFHLKKNSKDKYQFGSLKKLYQHRSVGMFPSMKGTELHTYTGIWSDGNSRYMIGEPGGMKPSGQPKANPIRQFTTLVGNGQVNMDLWLAAMNVRFIRYERFTVLPYPFKLIDMYNDIQKMR